MEFVMDDIHSVANRIGLLRRGYATFEDSANELYVINDELDKYFSGVQKECDHTIPVAVHWTNLGRDPQSIHHEQWLSKQHLSEK